VDFATGNHLAVWQITTDLEGQHLTYREYSLKRRDKPSKEAVRSTRGSIVLRINSIHGRRMDEEWRVTQTGGLIIVPAPFGPSAHRRPTLMAPASAARFEDLSLGVWGRPLADKPNVVSE
jgi:hypothetical protein